MSYRWGIIERMFDLELAGGGLDAPVDRMRAASRLEARAAAARLSAIWDLYIGKVRQFGESQNWAADTWDAVAAEVAAGLNIGLWLASSYVRYARVMHERIPPAAGQLQIEHTFDYPKRVRQFDDSVQPQLIAPTPRLRTPSSHY